MADSKLSLGQAIDQVIAALEPLEQHSRETALSAVCSHLKISVPSGASVEPVTDKVEKRDNSTQEKTPPNTGKQSASSTRRIDIRTFKEEKKPKSARQMACVVAYYLQELVAENERKEAISTSDLEKYFKQANYPLPEMIRQVLADSKKSGYFDSAGRGLYKLNAVGYNLVAHNLPAPSSGE